MSPTVEPPLESTDEQALSRLFDLHEQKRLCALIEAAVFAAPQPVTARQLARALEESEGDIQRLLSQIIAEHEKPERGIFLRKTGTGYQMGTKPEHHEALQEVLQGASAAKSALAPCLTDPRYCGLQTAHFRSRDTGYPESRRRRSAPNPSETKIDCSRSSQKKDAGNALLYRTTALFLKEFGLQTLNDLPDLQEFREVSYSLDEATIKITKKAFV